MNRLISSLLLMCAATLPAAEGQTGPLSVCQMLGSATVLSEATVRGQIVGEPHHGYVLVERINGDPCPGSRRRFLTAPSRVSIAFEPFLGVDLTDQQKRSNVDFLRRLISASGGHTVPYKVTVKGVLAAKSWPILFRRADGSYWCPVAEKYCSTYFVVKSIQRDPE